MSKIKPEDLDKITETIKRTIFLREGAGRAKVIIHMGTCGIAAGASIGMLVALTIWPLWTLVFVVMTVIGGLVAERTPSM